MSNMIISVLGNANIENNIEKQELAFNIGKVVIDNNYILATGGLGGVMKYASKGGKSSRNYKNNSIIGVIPSHNKKDANPYIDIVIPTGLSLARNLILVGMADAIIILGGGAGTLNEISLGWQLNKLIIAIDFDGWGKKVAGKQLDKRRDDIIFSAKDENEAMEIINEKIKKYRNFYYKKVKVPKY